MARVNVEELDVKRPKGERSCVIYCERGGKPLFLLTNKLQTGGFFLYEFSERGLVKLGKGLSPTELEERFEVKRRMGVE